jgi:hypothetical protein
MWSVGILVFVAGALLVTNVWAVVGARSSADQIARQYIRTYSEATTAADAASAGQRAAAVVASNRNVTDYRITPPANFGRCQMVAVTVAIDVPAIALPFIDGLGRRTVRATRQELTDPYRTTDGEETRDVATPCE